MEKNKFIRKDYMTYTPKYFLYTNTCEYVLTRSTGEKVNILLNAGIEDKE